MRAFVLVLAAAAAVAASGGTPQGAGAAARDVVEGIRFRSKAPPVKDQAALTQEARAATAGNGDNVAFPSGTAEKPHGSLVRVPGLPGVSDPHVDVAPLDAVGGNLDDTHSYATQASYEQNLKELVRELDESEEQARGLRLKLTDKDNLLGAMLHREKIIDIDLNEQKGALAAVNSHIQAVEARIDRLKKERRSLELMAQKHQYDAAADTLRMQVNDVQQVSSALDSRVKSLHSKITEKVQSEASALRKSLQPAVASGTERDEAAEQAVASAASSVGFALLQSGGRSLRGQ